MTISKVMGTSVALAALVLAGGISGSASAANVYALTNTNTLIGFNSSDPSNLTFNAPITGVMGWDSIANIDIRPATGEIFAIGQSTQVYRIDVDRVQSPQTATAVAIGNVPGIGISGSRYGFDFNPTVDRIRFTTNDEDNYRLNPITGGLAATDTDLAPAGNVVDVAYDRSFVGSTATSLYAIDADSDTLAFVGGLNSVPSPNGGAINTIGFLGVNISEFSSIDFIGPTLYGVFQVAGNTGLYMIDPSSGATVAGGGLAGNPTILGIAVEPDPIVQPKLQVKLSFNKPMKDSISLKGNVEIPAGFNVSGAEVKVNVGGVVRTYYVDDKGKAKTDTDSFQIKVKSKKGEVETQFAKFTLKIKNSDLAASFADEDLTNDDLSKVDTPIVTLIQVGETSSQSTIIVSYSAKAGKSGKAK